MTTASKEVPPPAGQEPESNRRVSHSSMLVENRKIFAGNISRRPFKTAQTMPRRCSMEPLVSTYVANVREELVTRFFQVRLGNPSANLTSSWRVGLAR